MDGIRQSPGQPVHQERSGVEEPAFPFGFPRSQPACPGPPEIAITSGSATMRSDSVWNASLHPDRRGFIHTNGVRLPPERIGPYGKRLIASGKSTAESCRLRYVGHSEIRLSSHRSKGPKASSASSRQARQFRSSPWHSGFALAAAQSPKAPHSFKSLLASTRKEIGQMACGSCQRKST